MAILKTLLYPVNTVAVLEDPTPGADTLFMHFDAYDKNTLAPLFDQGINHDLVGTSIIGFGVSNAYDSIHNLASRMTRIAVDGPVVDVQVTTTSAGTSQANIDPVMWLSMDPSRPVRKLRWDTNGVASITGIFLAKISNEDRVVSENSHNTTLDKFWSSVCLRPGDGPMAERLPHANANYIPPFNTANTVQRFVGAAYPVYLNNNTGNMILCTYMKDFNTDTINAAGTNHCMGWNYGARYDNYYNRSTPTMTVNGTRGGNKSQQLVGVDGGGRAIFLLNDLGNDYDQRLVRYIDSDNTAVLLANITEVPAAAGTSVGGNRGSNFGNLAPKWSSSTFEDPTSNGNRAWYTPYFDLNGKYHPFFFQWDTILDTFTRNSNITVNWGSTNQEAIWAPDLVSGTSVTTRFAGQRAWWNETWTVTAGNVTTRYLMLMQLQGSGTALDGIAKSRTFVTFSVDPIDPKILTYHSSFILPTTPKNVIFFNPEKTQMGVFCESTFYTYTFNQGSGWILSGTIPYKFSTVGVDSRNRIWALAAGPTRFGEIHLITLNVPVTISVVSPQTQYNYQGQNINSTLTVNAFDTTGNRISVPVKLVIDGGAMTFSGANLTTVVTTNTTTNTVVSTIITGAGVSNVIASVVL